MEMTLPGERERVSHDRTGCRGVSGCWDEDKDEDDDTDVGEDEDEDWDEDEDGRREREDRVSQDRTGYRGLAGNPLDVLSWWRRIDTMWLPAEARGGGCNCDEIERCHGWPHGGVY